MRKLLLRNVGDGLNLIINNKDHHDLTIDFGGDENIHCYGYFDDSFLLSHFHADHYNGILNCNHHRHWDLQNFYYPAMPAFTESKRFFMSLLTMNIRISNNHPIQNTIFDYVKRLNRRPLNFRAVSKGDIVVCGERKYEILWPPQELVEEDALIDIRNAIRDFEEARESDRQLSRIYQNISRRYAEVENINNAEIESPNDTDRLTEFDGELSEIVQKANKSLRKAANRLSIAFRQDDNILFLGDLESREINSVVVDLVNNHNIVYDILIAAHHGTHWHRSLNSINANICLASIGQTLKGNVKYEYKGISNKLVRTDEWGDIIITKRDRVR
ncbi:hypothetical protein [Cytophaga aurantiaca]|uniref:hypothetical protein n=1 Tax=Cytophaga aurantiaca TaxID=29530 RepID=UPI000379A1BC|nr:hypothetical protein [Cytophaga aurantiaca]